MAQNTTANLRLSEALNLRVSDYDLSGGRPHVQSAALGVAIVSTQAGHAESVLETVLGWIERNRPDMTIIDHTFEVIHYT